VRQFPRKHPKQPRARVSLKPHLSIEQIRAWADAHHAATGEWPTPYSGRVAAAPEHTWGGLQSVLHLGLRGLPAGMTLHKLLADRKRPRSCG
jgi:hypothetical protein